MDSPTLKPVESQRMTVEYRIKFLFYVSVGQVELQPERDRVRRAAAQRGAAREALRQEEGGEDRVHRARRSRRAQD